MHFNVKFVKILANGFIFFDNWDVHLLRMASGIKINLANLLFFTVKENSHMLTLVYAKTYGLALQIVSFSNAKNLESR